MNHYEERLAAKKERLEARAAKLQAESDAAYQTSKSMADAIPFGQPILVGHHSETRDRNYRAKIGKKMDKSIEMQKKADDCARRAANVGTGGISSDDPEAVAKLKSKLEGLEKAQKIMVAANKYVRNNDRDSLRALKLTERQIDELFKPDFCGRLGFPGYALSNNNAEIRRLKQRIEQLQKQAERENVEKQFDGFTYREDTEENRVMFLFDGKPCEETRKTLKSNGFKWSPRRGAWVRHLNGNGLWGAKMVIRELTTP